MFIKITRINTNQEEKECIVNTDKITGITEYKTRKEELYDIDGNVVETRTLPKLFVIKFDNHVETFINEENYETLTKALLK